LFELIESEVSISSRLSDWLERAVDRARPPTVQLGGWR